MEATGADTRTTLLGDEMIRICSTSSLHHRRPNRTPECVRSHRAAVAPPGGTRPFPAGLSPKRRQRERRSPVPQRFVRPVGGIVALWRKGGGDVCVRATAGRINGKDLMLHVPVSIESR